MYKSNAGISYGQRIATLRRKSKLTQEQLAEKLDVSPRAVHSWETDEHHPSYDLERKLAVIFGLSLSQIYQNVETNEQHIDIDANDLRLIKLCQLYKDTDEYTKNLIVHCSEKLTK